MPKRIVSFVFLLFLSCSPNVQAMEKENEYVLAVGGKGVRRLELQHELINDHTKKHLKMANLSKEKIVYDLGCGPGLVTVELAKSVNHVYAVDSSEEQLSLAKERVDKAGLTNVTFIHSDIRSLKNSPQEGEVDIVYTRCVLAHVNDPEKIIEVTKRLLKPNGLILSTEPVISSFWEPSQHSVFREWRKCGVEVAKKLGNDYDIGERLITLFDKKDFKVKKSFFVQEGPYLCISTSIS